MEKRFDEVVQSTMQKYDETFRKLAAGESVKSELLEQDIVNLAKIEDNGSSGLFQIGNKQ